MISSSEKGFMGIEAHPTSFPSACLPDLVHAMALETPDAIALSLGECALTYRSLDDRSTLLARSLRERGVEAGVLVGLLVDRSPAMVVALLAILKAGGAYVPLDPSYPLARLSSMLSLSAAALLIAESAVLARVSLHPGTPVLLLDAWEARPASVGPVAYTSHARPADTAYVIFTSGSTGEPKGVEIAHASLVNLLWSLRQRPGIRASDSVLAITSICFDIAAAELLLPLVVGARVEIASYEETADPQRLLARLETSGVTILQATPVTWRLLVSAGWAGRDTLSVWCGGEEMTRSLAAALLARSPTVWNLYGPTETTIWSAAIRIRAEMTSPGAIIPLGEPLANTSLYVLDEEQLPVAAGSAGELYIGGMGLAKGYWQRQGLTAQAFPQVPLANGRVVRLYKTGDRVRPHADGTLEFLGRFDRQVKLRGFRIELGEVEQALGSYPGVLDVAVQKIDDPDAGDFLAAYVVRAPGQALEPAKLRMHAGQALPRYMVPSAICFLDRLPVTPNGKVDRKQLPAPTSQERIFAAPDNVTDEIGSSAPKQDLETRLAQLWSESLRIPSIGMDDNFFALGGDSLLAAQLSAKMAKSFDPRCNVASLLQSPTVAAYATFLRSGRVANHIVLNDGSAEKRNQTIFWMDNPDKLHHLASLLGDQPFYSMLMSAEDLAVEAPAYHLERLAERMVKQILEQQSEGKFYLGGFCQNALLAYEVGQRLRARGFDVPLLIMVDPDDASINQNKRPVIATALRRVKREHFHLATMLRRPRSEWIPYLQRRYEGIRFVLEERKWQRIARAGEHGPQPARELAQALFVSRLHYVPRPYAGRVLFMEATLRPERDEQAAMAEWNSLVADARWRYVLGEHLGLFAYPAVETLAREVRSALDEGPEQAPSSD